MGGHQARGGSRWQPNADGSPANLIGLGVIRSSFGSEPKGALRIDLLNRAEHAKFHQFGTIHLPARPIIEVTKTDIARLRTNIIAQARQTMRLT
jgi:hypothetical protein